MKKILCVIMCLALVFALTPVFSVGAEADIVYGDVNDDGKIDAKDYVLVRLAELGHKQLTDAQLKVADVDGDGIITTKDAECVKNHILHLININNFFAPGDVDGDGAVTEADAELVRAYVLRLVELTERQLKAADVNMDGVINAKDYVAIKLQLVSN